MLVNKIITHRIGNRLRQSGSGLAGINLRDYGIERKFSWDRGIDEPYWGPSLGNKSFLKSDDAHVAWFLCLFALFVWLFSHSK